MTPEEFKQKIAESKRAQLFNEVIYNLHTAELNNVVELKGLNAMYDFATQQLEGWEKVSDKLPERLEESQSFFTTFRTELIDFVSNYADSSYYDSTESIQTHLRDRMRRAGFREAVFLYDSPETAFLIKLHQELPDSFEGAIDFILEAVDLSQESNQSHYLTGILHAYEFKAKGNSHLVDRSTAEKSSFEEMRGTLQKQLIDSSAYYKQYQTDIHQKYVESIAQIDDLRNEKATDYNTWFKTTQTDFTTFKSDADTKIADLQKTFKEHLRLESPTQYWKQRAETLHKKGMRAMYWLIGIIVFTCVTLYCLLWMTPEGMLRSFFNGDAVAIKWSVIYVTFISFLAYLVRALHRVSFSAFHLSRDAEEREQLTHVYLALIKDGAVEEKDKHLILQSLFSRADTGLLKDDSGPTMPGSIIEKAAK